MNKRLEVIVCCFGLLAQSTVLAQAIEGNDLEFGALSLRAGTHGWRDTENVESSYGVQAEISFVSLLPLFDLDVRFSNANVKYDDTYEFGRKTCWNNEASSMGGCVALVYNLTKKTIIVPYLSLGAMYEKTEYEYDGSYYSYAFDDYRDYAEDGHEEGVTYVVRLGATADWNKLFFHLEGSLIGKIYDYDDNAQAEILVIIGYQLLDAMRFDIAYDYYSGWKEYYLTAGITIHY